MSDYIEIGLVGRAHGISGEVRLNYFADSLDLLQGPLFLKDGVNAIRSVQVKSKRLISGQPVVMFDGFPDRTAVESLRGQTLLVPRSALPEIPDDETYLDDLIGCTVLHDADGRELGTLTHFLFTTDPEIWGITSSDGRELLCPGVPEFIRSIDLSSKSIRIQPPDGLLELYGFAPEHDAGH